MKVLMVNKFNYLKGGADKYFLDLADLLRANGVEVVKFCMADPKNLPDENEKYFVSYVDIKQPGLINKLRYLGRIFYSFEAKRKFRALIEKTKPDVIHLHNIYHQISPSILDVAREKKIPVIMHLHDYKLISPNYTMFDKKGIDDSTIGGNYFNCVWRRSFKNSFILSFVVALEMYFHHKILKIYEKSVDLYITPSDFMRSKIIQAGFDGKKIITLPNFVNGLENFKADFIPGDYFLFFGRLSAEKGVNMLLEALAKLPNEKLKIVGSGDEENNLKKLALELKLNKRVEFLGAKYNEDLFKIIRAAKAVVVPSIWYEVFGIVNIEAAALGKAIIASDIGGLPESVIKDKTALLYKYDSVDDLVLKMKIITNDKALAESYGKAGRQFVMANFTASAHLPKILAIYEKVLHR